MAYSRETFKDRIEEKVRGAMSEYYKAETARANGLKKWVEHWQGEAQRLIQELEDVILPHAIRGFRDRRKAFQEVIDYVRKEDDHYRESACRIVAHHFDLRKRPSQISEAVSRYFFEMLESLSMPE